MLRLLRPAGRPTALRRLLATLLWSVLAVSFGAEPLLADACDGDAPAAAVAAVLPHADADVFAAGLTGRGVVVADTVVGAVDTAGTARVDPGDGATPDGSPEHAVHVCHCTHAHGATPAVTYVVISARTRPVAPVVAWRPDRLPPSPTLEPQLRPPARPHAA